MAYTDEEVRSYLQNQLAGASDREIAAAMTQFGVGGDQMSRVTGVSQGDVQRRFEAAQAPTNTYSDAQVQQYLAERPGYTDTQIAADMIRYGVGPGQVARVTQLPLTDVQARYDAILGPLGATVPGGAVTPTNPSPKTVIPGGGTTNIPTPRTPVPVPEGLMPGNVDERTILSTPAITQNVVPQMPTEYVQPQSIMVGGALQPEYTAPPAGVPSYALPQLNMRNIVNQGVVPNYVAMPTTNPGLNFSPIFTIGDRIF